MKPIHDAYVIALLECIVALRNVWLAIAEVSLTTHCCQHLQVIKEDTLQFSYVGEQGCEWPRAIFIELNSLGREFCMCRLNRHL